MFDFENLIVYKKAKSFNKEIRTYLRETKLDVTTTDQLRRAAFSIILNIAEGTGRFSKRDKRHFYVVARSSIFECIAILDVLIDENQISKKLYDKFYLAGEELSKILYKMIRNLE